MTSSRSLPDLSLIPSEQQDLLRRMSAQASALDVRAFVVGGFVRDLFLRRPVKDLDVIIEGDAIRFGESLVKQMGGKLTAHHKFHTAIWQLPSTSETIDLITARKETYVKSGSLPSVTPSTIEDDLRRRDFTINAMALRLGGDLFSELLDPLNGRDDLEKKTIRALHPRSFVDDPTRIFRAVRYEQRYGFQLDPSTASLVSNEALAVLASLSGERIRHELDLLLAEENAFASILRIANIGLPSAIHPDLAKVEPHPFPDRLSDEFDSLTVRYLLWLTDAPAGIFPVLAQRLDFSSDLTTALTSASHIRSTLPTFSGRNPSVWTFELEKHPPVSIYAVHLVSREPALAEYLSTWRHVKPMTTGNHLKALGVLPGPRYKEILTSLRAAWLDGAVSNESQEKEMLKTLL